MVESICYLTKFPWRETEYEAFLVKDESGKVVELSCQRTDASSMVGNIYVGKVERVVPQIGGAFVRIARETTVFLPLEDAKNALYTQKLAKREELCGGDELLIQIEKDPIKTKDATASANLSFASEHLLLTTAKPQIGVSRKLPEETRKAYKESLAGLDTTFGFVVRTSAGEISAEALREEAESLAEQTKTFLELSSHRPAYSLVRRAEHPFLKRAKKFWDQSEKQGTIRTDLPELYHQLRENLPETVCPPAEKRGLSFYEDETYPLYKLIGLPTIVERALAKKVYLSSGAYLVIEPTEALTVIDVNSGKRRGKGLAEDYYYQVNLEAAEEIARQLRLRNISGMIVVDFINMRDEERCDQVLTRLRSCCSKDALPVQVLDYTRLHLVEMTRKKEFAPLAQQMDAAFYDKD